MKKVICFCRVSSKKQDLEYQRKEVMKAILHDGYKESEIAIVEGKESAIKLKLMERQTIEEMNDLIEENPTIESVYFYAIDRLARSVSVVLTVVDKMVKKGVNLVFLNPYRIRTLNNGKADPMGKMFLTFLSIGAEMEMQMKKERFEDTKALMRERQQITGAIAYGYKADANKQIAINEDEAKVILKIFEMYTEKGMSTNAIWQECLSLGYFQPLKSNAAGASKIRQILLNPIYIGGQGDTKHPTHYLPIVDKETFEKAREIMTEARQKPKYNIQNKYYCKGLLRETINNTCLVADKARARYTATSAQKEFSININVCDSVVWYVAKQTKYTLLRTGEANAKATIIESLKEVETKLENLKNKMNEVDKRYERLEDLYVNVGMRRDRYIMRRKDIEREERKITAEVTALNKRKLELENLLAETETKEDKDKSLVMSLENVSDDDERISIIKETIKNAFVTQIDRDNYVIGVYNVLGDRFSFDYQRTHGRQKKHVYEQINNDVERLDITDKIEERFKRLR
jgi:site-specific DNA recombinase